MSGAAGFVWRLTLPRDAAEAAFLELDDAVETMAAEGGLPAVAIDLALPEAAADASRAQAVLTVTMTGETVETGTAEAVARRLFARLEETLSCGALPARCPPPEPLPERDWVRLSQSGLPAQLVGRFRIVVDAARKDLWPGRQTLRLTASTAFGTGHHPTTRGALAMLDALARHLGRRRPMPMLDVGCGSAVLALAMTKLWKRPVWASDIDAAVRPVVAAHAHRNGVALRARAVRGKGPALACLIAAGLDHPALRRAGPFRLIVANILAGPLKTLAPVFSRHLAPEGWLLLSGILADEARAVARRYRRFGLVPVRLWSQEGWMTIALRRASCARRPLPPAGRLRQRAADPDAHRPRRAGRP